jgi:hypothetical protein
MDTGLPGHSEVQRLSDHMGAAHEESRAPKSVLEWC